MCENCKQEKIRNLEGYLSAVQYQENKGNEAYNSSQKKKKKEKEKCTPDINFLDLLSFNIHAYVS